MNKTPIAFTVIRTRTCQQETYETTARHAAIRARQLRKAGYKVTTSPMGEQVTAVGRIKLTILTVWDPDDNLPAVEIANWRETADAS